MTATQLMADLTGLGIQLVAHGDRLRYAPRSAVTPDLADQMKVHKPELLEMLRVDGNEPNIDPTNVTSVWQAALDQLEGDPLFPPDVMNALRAANVYWASDESPVRPTDDSKFMDLGPDGWPVNSIDPRRTGTLPEMRHAETVANSGRQLAMPAMRPADQGAASTGTGRTNTPGKGSRQRRRTSVSALK